LTDTADSILERFAVCKTGRANFDSTWQDVAELMNPHGGDFNTKRSPGEKRSDKVFDQTAVQSLEKFTAAMEAFNTPRTQRWSHLRASDDDLNKVHAVREWFEEAESLLYKMRNNPRARFYGQTYEVYKSLGLTGNGCMFVDEAPKGGIRYRATHVGQTWIETSFEGVVDTIYYEYELTAKAAIQKWGEDAPESARTNASAAPLQLGKYVHCVRPNTNKDRKSKGPESMEFEAFDISSTDRKIIGKPSGYHEMPYMWTRYTVSPSEIYGRGPGMMVLPDVQTLQEMQKTFLRAGHKVADPPLLVADDKKLGRGSRKIRIAPGGINIGGVDKNGRPTIMPLQTGARIDMTEGMMETLRDNIREAFLVNHFDILVRDRVQMTATETLERAKEKGQLLTPVIGRQQSEFLGPMIERELSIAQRQGLLPPVPPELAEASGEYEIEYETDATRMQRTDEISAFMKLQEVMGMFIETDPSLLQKIDAEKAMEHYGQDLGVPQKLFRSEDEMDAIHEQQQQAAQAEQMAKQGPGIAKTVQGLSAVGAA
jgi:hypothetical protein